MTDRYDEMARVADEVIAAVFKHTGEPRGYQFTEEKAVVLAALRRVAEEAQRGQADAMALVLSHEGHIAKLESDLAASREQLASSQKRCRDYGDGKLCRAHGEAHPDCTDAMHRERERRLREAAGLLLGNLTFITQSHVGYEGRLSDLHAALAETAQSEKEEHKKHPSGDYCVFCHCQWPCEESRGELGTARVTS